MGTTNGSVVPNHHADHPGFAGLSGVVAAMTMAFGRRGLVRLAAELADLDTDDCVVDVGCGPGTAARYAARRGAAVTGLDPSAVMLRTARLLSVGRGISWIDGVAEALPLPDAWASVVWSLATVHHWQDVDAGVAECTRVLRPGGRLVAIESLRAEDATGLASHGWTEPQAGRFAEICSGAGLDDAHVVRHGSLVAVRAMQRRA